MTDNGTDLKLDRRRVQIELYCVNQFFKVKLNITCISGASGNCTGKTDRDDWTLEVNVANAYATAYIRSCRAGSCPLPILGQPDDYVRWTVSKSKIYSWKLHMCIHSVYFTFTCLFLCIFFGLLNLIFFFIEAPPLQQSPVTSPSSIRYLQCWVSSYRYPSPLPPASIVLSVFLIHFIFLTSPKKILIACLSL